MESPDQGTYDTVSKSLCEPHPVHGNERLELAMSDTRSRSGILVGLAAAVGAFGAAAMMSATTAPTARADDFGDVINAIDGDYAAGQADITTAFTDFSSNELAPGLLALVNGTDEEALSPSVNLLAGTIELLTNEPVNVAIPWEFVLPADFSDAVTTAEAFLTGNGYFESAVTAFSLGEYGTAAYDDLVGLDVATIAPLQELLLGAAVSF
jgi:hypothetical protein